MGGELMGGYVSIRRGDDMSDVVKRLLSPVARGKRILLFDNVKTHKFSWDDLEGLITSSQISGRQMYMGEGSIPNTLTVVITLNGASLSTDMTQRCVPVELKRPAYFGSWEEDTRKFIHDYRWAILGDIDSELRKPRAILRRHTRWGQWERDVLALVPLPEECQNLIESRQVTSDADDDEAVLIRDAIFNGIARSNLDPNTTIAFLPTTWLRDMIVAATGEPISVLKATPRLKTLSIPELRWGRTAERNGWWWQGIMADPAGPVQVIKERPGWG